MYKGLNCDRKSQLSEILTEPLNPRGPDKIMISLDQLTLRKDYN